MGEMTMQVIMFTFWWSVVLAGFTVWQVRLHKQAAMTHELAMTRERRSDQEAFHRQSVELQQLGAEPTEKQLELARMETEKRLELARMEVKRYESQQQLRGYDLDIAREERRRR